MSQIKAKGKVVQNKGPCAKDDSLCRTGRLIIRIKIVYKREQEEKAGLKIIALQGCISLYFVLLWKSYKL